MAPRIQDELDRLARCFLAGEIEETLRFFTFPFCAFESGLGVTYARPEDLARVFSAHREAAMAQGLVDFRGRAVAQTIPRSGRFQIWVDWHYRLERCGRVEKRVNRSRYFCRSLGNRFTCDMLDRDDVAIPAVGSVRLSTEDPA